MAWVRLHDGAMQNLKVAELSDSAFRLWVRGLCYCQTALTDGLIPHSALRDMGAKRKDVDELAAPQVENRAPLWERIDQFGFKVHDYLDWNDSREKVTGRQSAARARKEAFDAKRRSERVTERDTESVPNAHAGFGLVNSTDLSTTEKTERESEGKPARGQKQAGRIFLHRWQLDALIDTLGPHAADFGLDGWLDALNANIADKALPRDPWKFVQSELHAELQRRGLAVAEETAAQPTNKRIAGLVAGGEAFLRRQAEKRARGIT